jgi:hypothetical protein
MGRWDAKVRVRGIVFGCFAESVPKSLFRDLGIKNDQKRAKREPKVSKREPEVAKGRQREPKGRQREPKWRSKAHKDPSKTHPAEKYRKGGQNREMHPQLFGTILVKIPSKMSSTIHQKTMAKNTGNL